MGDRIHPRDSSTSHDDHHLQHPHQEHQEHQEDEEQPNNNNNKPTTGTYVVQIPKDQIYRHPPPENARRYQKYLRRQNRRRNPCCCCFCWTLGILAMLLLLAAITAGVFYFVVKPKIPTYTIDNLSIKGMDFQQQQQRPPSPDQALSPEINVVVRTQNPNKKIGIHYVKGSSVAVSHSTNTLCSGTLPVFYQRAGNLTVFQTDLKSAGLKLRDLDFEALREEQRKGKVPLGLDLKVPVRVKVGVVKTWVIIVKVHCDITVDQLTVKSKIVSKDCRVKVKPW